MIFSGKSVKLPAPLHARAAAVARQYGYSSLDEFVAHALEKELARLEEAEAKEAVVKQLKGLGYLE